jgi:endo-1,3(4)-beta-glucanase
MWMSGISRMSGAVACGLAVVLLAGCATTPSAQESGSAHQAAFSDAQLGPLLDAVPARSVAKPPRMRLAHGLAPPTNRWFSGLVFGAAPLPVFPLPLSFGLTGSGFAFGVPAVHTGADTITGGLQPDIALDAGAASSIVSAYDEASVTIDELDGSGRTLGSIVIAEGSPLVSFTAKRDVTLTLPRPFTRSGNQWTAKVGDSEYALITRGELRSAGGSLSLKPGQTAVWIAVPKGGDTSKLASLAAPLVSTSLGYSTGGKRVSTAIGYRTKDESDTLFTAMPHQRAALDPAVKCDLGSYPSIYGTLSLCSGTSLKWTSPALKPTDSLPLDSLNAGQKDTLRKQLVEDTEAQSKLPADTYFGGKALYRLANLLDLATQLGDKDSAATLQKRLSAALLTWTEPDGCTKRDTRCFVYDKTMRGIVGLTASFGSDQFNDHHFHYGYFLYAASVAARHDPALVKRIAPVIDLLAADLATDGPSKYFPDRRVFDAYAGHSWASGLSPFADGNNQESSSEAVSAWNGLALWAGVTKNADLEREAVWMLSSEAASARLYWTDFDAGDPVYDGYGHSIVSLNWGGKRDYATWFSAEPNAKLAILLLPMSPVAGYLGGDPQRVSRNLSQGAPAGYDVALGDYLLMYSAMAGPAQAARAVKNAETLPEKWIDGGNSRSYMLAWVMTR